MSVTPLYTAAELDAEIIVWKQALRALAMGEEYTCAQADGSRQTVRRAQLPQIEARLEKLQSMRVQLSSGNGPQMIQGRVKRG